MAAITSSFFSLPFHTTLKAHRPTLLSSPNLLKPNSTLKFPRLGISHAKIGFPVVISCLVENNSETFHESEGSSGSNESTSGTTIDLKLPRRSLLVHFTCNACGERSQKLINRLAYEKGTVFVQCSGCSQYHKLVDNLSLVVEYDLREEMSWYRGSPSSLLLWSQTNGWYRGSPSSVPIWSQTNDQASRVFNTLKSRFGWYGVSPLSVPIWSQTNDQEVHLHRFLFVVKQTTKGASKVFNTLESRLDLYRGSPSSVPL